MAVAVKIENLSKIYRLGEIGTGTISQDLHRWFAKTRGKEDPFLKIGQVENTPAQSINKIVYSLKDINLTIEQGDTVGVIGKNGAGKSTLLKILSQVTSPTTGKIKIKGRIASLLEVGTGFHPELSGKENIYLNGAILGMRKAEIDRQLGEIIEFSGISTYIDTPVKRYSSGMYVRLAFAVAAHLDAEILVVDEILAVGDVEFQKKCLGKMSEISKGGGRTVLFVSHNMGAVQQLCNSAVLLNKGSVYSTGARDKVINQYLKINRTDISYYKSDETVSRSKFIWFRLIQTTSAKGSLQTDFFHDEPIVIDFEIGFSSGKEDNKDYKLFCTITDSLKNPVFSAESDIINCEKMQLHIQPEFLVRGEYQITAFIHKPQVEQIDRVEDVCAFSVIDNGSDFNIHGNYDYGKVFGRYNWKEIDE